MSAELQSLFQTGPVQPGPVQTSPDKCNLVQFVPLWSIQSQVSYCRVLVGVAFVGQVLSTPLDLHNSAHQQMGEKKTMLTDTLTVYAQIHPHTFKDTCSTDIVNMDTANEAEDKDRTLPV